MRTKLVTSPAGLFRGQTDVTSLVRDMNDWLAARPQFKVVDHSHTMASGIWIHTPLVVALNDEEPAN